MRKWIKRILMALGGLALVLFLAVYFGGRLAAQKYLARDLTVGDGKIRLVSPRFLWSLELSADSALYDSPTLRAAAGRTVVSANLFKSLFRFSPSVTLDVDTLWVRVSPGPDTVKPKKDSIPFTEFSLPASIQVRAERVAVFDSAADSLGPMVRADGLDMESLGPQAVRLAIRDARVRQTGALAQAIEVSADWADSQQVTAKLSWKSGEDAVSLSARLQKANLLRAAAELRAHVASTAPYYKILKLSGNPPIAEGFEAEFRAALDRTLRLEGGLTARVHGFSDSAPLKLGPQKVAVTIDFKDSAGTWSATSRGERGEDVVLKGDLFATATDSLADPAWLAGHLGISARGHARGIMVDAAGKKMRADLEVAELKASGETVRARIRTGDDSRITADLRKAPGVIAKVPKAGDSPAAQASRTAQAAAKQAKSAKAGKGRKGNTKETPSALPDWNGVFSADITPGERWMVAFTDTNLVFKKAHIAGKVRNGEVSAVMDLTALRAYGVVADSARLNHRYGKAGYTLEPSHLYWRGADWELAGKVDLSRPGGPMEARFGNSRFGKVDAAMPRPGVMELHARDLALEHVPYKGMDTLKSNQPRVTADFSWDKNKRTGSADLQVDGRFKGETLKAKASADWDPERLVVKETRASMAGSELTASAKVFLRGKHFYDLAKLAKEDFEEVALSSDRFDIAKAMSVAMPEPPLKSGTAAGRFSYRADVGFDGTYKFQNIRLAPTGEEEKITLKELAVIGKGDTLLVKLVTVSQSEPLFNDSATVALTGVLAKEQGLIVRARLGQKVFLDFQGRIQDFNRLTGRLGIRGDAVLPQASGELRDVKVRANVVFPFKEGLKGLRLEADTLSGRYMVAGLDTQTFSAPVQMIGGKIAIPSLTLRSKGGAVVNGRFELDPATKRMNGNLSGNSLAAQLGAGDKIKLRDFKLELRGDSTTINLQVDIGSGSAEHVKAPMRAAGDFSRVSVIYRAPLGKNTLGTPSGARIPYVKVQATLDSSDVRYRIRSMETLQNLFKRTPENRAAKRSKPVQVQIDVETAGRGNSIETDILRVSYVGNLSMYGTYPYALVQGRISSYQGELGTKKQAYAIRRMDVKWLNTPLEEGKVELEAKKRLARNCEAGTLDSCNITTRLTGELSDMQFTYDSDCQGAGGAGVEVSALVYSVRRGCYSSAFRGGGSGESYTDQAFGLLEPVASQYLSDAAGKLTGNWISSAQITGLGALTRDDASTPAARDSGTGTSGGAGAADAIALELLSKEFWRTRLRVKSAYAPETDASISPWNYRVGLEWRPPLPGFVEDPEWRQRLKNNVNMEAAVFTDPDRTQLDVVEDALRKRLGLNYTYDFWGSWWGKRARSRAPDQGISGIQPAPVVNDKTSAAQDSTR